MTVDQHGASAIMRTQIERGLGIPRDLYLCEELFEREVDAIFDRTWLPAGHVSQLSAPGRYLTVESGRESIVVARTAEGDLAAFHNVCRHRGARLVDPGCGSARRLVCPYHQWTYRMDGSLQGAPKMPADFDSARHPLPRVHVATWQGLVFVSLAADPGPSPQDLLGVGEPLIAPFDLAGATVAHSVTYDVAANWKLVWENAQECYHCTANHPELLKAFDVTGAGSAQADPGDLHRSADNRVQYARFTLKAGAASLTVDGRPASAKPMGEFAHGREPYTVALHLKPTFAVVCSPDYAVVLRDRPISVDRTEVTMQWLVRGDAEADVDYDLDNLIKVWDRTNRQDWALCERTQLGVRSRSFEPGPLSDDESSVAAFHRAYAEMLAGAGL
ncbi:aromatic ring-hydroxylating oxygenase subunit alpha [Embleya scabrispora]|uniref:aromatic ring-hydroxylating oxygenase subunit alpha n=1 Tax=Embleya scabrispora TaxID=159449 RepID=UPI00036A2C83|nr:aromatic ring-hydroxylating dioxygenase subunit alpha [Embleya scabrispora]MYS86915.1 Rieske 2Fe-2S domain-containing protein [Streptomyces sp. SID5474]